MQETFQDEGLSIMEDRTGKKDDNRLQDMDEESSGEEGGEDGPPNSQPQIQPPLPPAPDKVLVKKYDPKQRKYEFDYLLLSTNFVRF